MIIIIAFLANYNSYSNLVIFSLTANYPISIYINLANTRSTPIFPPSISLPSFSLPTNNKVKTIIPPIPSITLLTPKSLIASSKRQSP